MNLRKYSEILLGVLAEHKTDTEVEAAACSNTPDEEQNALEKYEAVAQEIRQAISRNKNLLGVFPESPITDDQQEKILEKEIRKRDLLRHIVKVRMDIKTRLGTDIAKSILTDLSQRLDLQKLGGVFGKQEKKAYQREFPSREESGNDRDLILERLKERTKDPEYRKAMERLRRNGKIL